MPGEEGAQPGLGFRSVLGRDLQQQVMLVALAELAHALGQVRGQQAGQNLHHPVSHPTQAQPFEPAVDAALQCERGRYTCGAEAVDQQKAVLAVALADVVGIAVDVLTGNRQALEAGQQLATDRREAVGAVAADVEDFGGLLSKVSRRTANTASLPAEPAAS